MGSEGVLSPGRGYGFGCWGGVGLNQDAHLSTWRPPLLALPKPAPAASLHSLSRAVSGIFQTPAADKPRLE